MFYKTNKKILLFLLICSCACMLLLSSCSIIGTRINLNKYLDISYNGYNGGGNVTASLNLESLEADYGDKIVINTDSSLYSLYDGMTMSEIINDMVAVDFSPNGSLSNGDKTMEDWNVDKEHIEEILDCTIAYSEKTITVKDLPDTVTFDPFEDVDIVYSGMDGYGTALIVANNEFQDYYDFITEETDTTTYAADELDGLSNGDEITVEFYVGDDIQEFIDEYGMAPEQTTKTYVVEGLDEVGAIDVFNDATIDLSGAEPYGKATFVISDEFKTDNWYPPYEYSIDKDSGISNGDIITATFTVTDVEAFIDRYGSLPAEEQRQYSVSGLDSYILSIDDLSDSEINELTQAAKEQVAQKAPQNIHFYVDGREISDVRIEYQDDGEPAYTYFYLRNDGPDEDGKLSSIAFVYEINAVGYDTALEGGHTETYDGYYIVTFDNLFHTASGELIGTENVAISDAYDSFDSLYSENVMDKRDEYTIATYEYEEDEAEEKTEPNQQD